MFAVTVLFLCDDDEFINGFVSCGLSSQRINKEPDGSEHVTCVCLQLSVNRSNRR